MEHYRTGVKVESGQRRKKKSKKDGSNPDSINEYMPSQSCWGVAGGGGGGGIWSHMEAKQTQHPKLKPDFHSAVHGQNRRSAPDLDFINSAAAAAAAGPQRAPRQPTCFHSVQHRTESPDQVACRNTL